MAATPIDELIKTIESVKVLKETVRDHVVLIRAMVGRLDQIEQRLSALEPDPPPPARARGS